MTAFSSDAGGVRLTCRVIPGSRQAGWGQLNADHVVIRLTARAVDGKANKALQQFLADAFATAPSRVLIERGEKNRLKRVLIRAPGAIPPELMP